MSPPPPLMRSANSLLAQRHDAGAKVSMEIYYESLCPQSLRLLNGTLREVWAKKDMQSRVSFKFIPFGNAQEMPASQISDGYKYWHPNARFPLVLCQHGETECLGNRIHACAMDILKTPDKYVPFLICMASYGPRVSVELSSFECANAQGVSMKEIKSCATSDRGHKLHVANGALSTKPSLKRSYVPWVLINGKHDKTAEGPNLLAQLCGALADPKPGSCTSAEPAKPGALQDDTSGEGLADGTNKTDKKNKNCGTGGKGGSGGDFF
eukprot:CAMPEP_0204563596 /NCGR_PEP_ID=MMETSP0661-20131031/34400_1 /ASSEMBLY_ACC=CAM_ASM_000606 /TAXON_ID=109239 /ORGANISM="Alexandrium margalefi, Strain AMGDE01CS-322" /LENGTH=266 /DNA_ID=CAMNT_0051571165 /DNA_START=161 /DNA_END=961 /DNA_ORIENTATION=-